MRQTGISGNPDQTFARAVLLILDHQRLMDSGNGESEQAESLREEMDDLWLELTEAEQQFICALSAIWLLHSPSEPAIL